MRRPKTLADFSNMASALLRLDFDAPYFYFAHTRYARIRFDTPVPWTLDGEYGGDVQEAEIRNHPGAIQILCPSEDA